MCKEEGCTTEYAHPRYLNNRSTANLTKHIKAHNKKAVHQRTIEGTRDIQSFTKKSIATEEELQELLLDAMVSCNWSFLQFHNPAFIRLINRGFPEIKMPSRKTMRRVLRKEADKARAEMKARFVHVDSAISIALDC